MSTSPIKPEPDFGLNLDLDGARAARAEKQKATTVTIGGKALLLPLELPLWVLDPLTTINVDVSLLIRQIMDARTEGGPAAAENMAGAVVDMLVVNPDLPKDLIAAVKEMTRRLFGDKGYDHLVQQSLSLSDISVLVKWLLQRYGVGLGEASRSSDSSEDSGTTSKETSPGEVETSATSGGRRKTRSS